MSSSPPQRIDKPAASLFHPRPIRTQSPVIPAIITTTLALLSLTLHAWQWLAGRRFPLRIEMPEIAGLPAVTILKPIGSLDETTETAVEGWLQLEAPEKAEILFGVEAADAPLREQIEKLIVAASGIPARVIPCPAPSADANPKVAKLIELEKHAAHDCLLVSDADVTVEPDFLRRFLAEFVQSGAEAACCLYRIRGGRSLAQKLEQSSNNIDFWSQVAQAASMGPVDFALGAAMVISRDSLMQIGGFEGIAGHIADDFQFGNRIHRQGGRIHIASSPVDCRHGSAGARDILRRQIRWARTMRVCKPSPYFFSILSNPTIWPLGWYLTAPADPVHAAVFTGCVLLRVALARRLASRFLGTSETGGIEWLAPLRDLFHALLWLTAFSGNRVVWGGKTYRLKSDGTMRQEQA